MNTQNASSPDRPRVSLSILDLAPVSAGSDAAQALRDSTQLAQAADSLGYLRYWMAEHHGSETFMSSATAVLLAHVASHTRHLRVGAGGVMLPNHAPLMVAEYYGTLATLYGNRIDLGLGRAPGTDPMTASALSRSSGQLDTFARDVVDLATWLGDPPSGGRLRVRALPGEGTRVPMWMLGSSLGGASVAAALGLPFSFASHFAPDAMSTALATYRENFVADAPTAQVPAPRVMAGVNVVVAPTQEEADLLATTSIALRTRIRTGRLAPLDPPNPDLVRPPRPRGPGEPPSFNVTGAPDSVVERLESLVAEFGLDELIVTTYTWDPALRIRSYELLARAWGLTPR